MAEGFEYWDTLGNIPPIGIDGVESGGFEYWDTLGIMPVWTLADAPPVYTVTPSNSVVGIHSSAVTVAYNGSGGGDNAAILRKKRRRFFMAALAKKQRGRR